MSNILNHLNCPMRTELGNCNCGGGFCTSVKKEVCDALHDAYRIGFLNGQRYEKERRNDENVNIIVYAANAVRDTNNRK